MSEPRRFVGDDATVGLVNWWLVPVALFIGIWIGWTIGWVVFA